MGVNSLPKTVTRQRRDCDLNPGRSAPESSTLTTRLPSHPRSVTASTLCSSICEKYGWKLTFLVFPRYSGYIWPMRWTDVWDVNDESLLSSRIKVIFSGTLSQTLDLENFATASQSCCRQNWSTVELVDDTYSGRCLTSLLGWRVLASRSGWVVSASDCGVRGPGFESHRGRLCLLRQPLRYTALGTGCAPLVQCLGRLSFSPSAGR